VRGGATAPVRLPVGADARSAGARKQWVLEAI